MRNFFSFWMDMAAATAEAQQVIGLRMLKLAAGGPAANAEAALMINEKMAAGQRAALQTLGGADPQKILRGLRTTVRANRRRLMR